VSVANLRKVPPSRQGKADDINGTGKLGANPANWSPLTPLGFLERAATIFGDCPSVVYHDTVFTCSQTYRRCLRLASALVSLGISRGDIVSHLWSINSANFAPRWIVWARAGQSINLEFSFPLMLGK
jgi:hypothetical protein